ncbi:MAG: hypothetical protein VX498_00340 [Myxococcota bacterium]|nr:hypothetical protein [Myxococcota bacterium]
MSSPLFSQLRPAIQAQVLGLFSFVLMSVAACEEHTPGHELKADRAIEIHVDPAPDKPGGNLFLAGFKELDKATMAPEHGAAPDDFVTVAVSVPSLPWAGEVKLRPGLSYFALYGHGDFPDQGDRVSKGNQVMNTGSDALVFRIGPKTAPPSEPDTVAPKPGPIESVLPPGMETTEVKLDLAVEVSVDEQGRKVVHDEKGLATKVGTSRLLVLGFEPIETPAPGPEPEQEPSYVWASPTLMEALPTQVVVPMPHGLEVVVILSASGSLDVSEQDLRGSLLPATESWPGALSYNLADTMRSSTAEAPSPFHQEPGVQSSKVKLTVTIPWKMRLPLRRPKGKIMIIGSKHDQGVEAAAKPDFFWMSEEVGPSWPVTIDAVLPHNLDVLIVVDLDDDKTPGTADLGGEMLKLFSPPATGALEYPITGHYQPLKRGAEQNESYPGER